MPNTLIFMRFLDPRVPDPKTGRFTKCEHRPRVHKRERSGRYSWPMQTGFRRPTSARRAGSARPEPWSLPASSSYEPALDGLRAVSILFVVLSHAGLMGIMPANFGVTIFFFISGFLISRLLLAEYGRRGHISLGRFYMRRFLRLMPALILYVAVAGAIFSILGYTLLPAQYASALFYWANYYGIYLDDVG